VGAGALTTQNFSSATNTNNTAVGYGAGTAVTTGTLNTLVGSDAGDALSDADKNVAIGYQALSGDTKGNKTVAVGTGALLTQNFTSSTDSFNTAIGHESMYLSQTSLYNTALGFQSGYRITTGGANTLLGYIAGDHLTSGEYNVMIGFAAGTHDRNTNGSNNILIGAFVDANANSGTDASNQIVLGYNVVGQGSGNFTFGKDGDDSNIAFGATSISAPSDERYKEEIETSTAGLSFLNDLRPVTFKWKKQKDIPSDHRSYVKDSDTRVMGKGEKVQHGFIAQEVKTVIDNHSEIKDGFNMWSEDNIEGRQRLAEGELIPMLVKGIQELSTKNDALEARIKTLEGE
jgi:hypothetical protein